MSQQEWHLTTEELSASIDKQLSPQEQARCDAHLQTCERCQLELAGLRRTVALLHALPRPALPRSFALPVPVEREPVQIGAMRLTPVPALAPIPARQQKPSWAAKVRPAIRVMSTLAAVLGVVILFSSLLMYTPQMNHSATQPTSGAAPAMAQATPTTGPYQAQSAPTPTPTPGLQATSGSNSAPAATATAENQGGQTDTANNAKTPVRTPAKAEAGQDQFGPRSDSQEPSPFAFIPDFFDVTTPAGLARLGIVLVILGSIGVVLLRPRKKSQETS